MAKSILAGGYTVPTKPIPEKILLRMREIAEAFQGVNDCWEWPHSRNVRSGYGQLACRIDGKQIVFTAHRVSFAVFNGSIQPGKLVCHTCDNRGCFNPKHLYQGTLSDNTRDMYERGGVDRKATAARGNRHGSKTKPERTQRGTVHHASKLNDDIVREIRASGSSCSALAKLYGVSDATINSVQRGVTWTHVK